MSLGLDGLHDIETVDSVFGVLNGYGEFVDGIILVLGDFYLLYLRSINSPLRRMKERLMKITTAVGTSIVALGFASNAMAADYQVTVLNLTSGLYFTPVIVSAHAPSLAIFQPGTPASEQLQVLAEGGDVTPMAELLEGLGASVATGSGLLAPHASVEFTLSGNPGDVLSAAAMLLPTNDGFAGLNSVSLPAAGETVTFTANGYDAGTEGNNEVVGTAEIGVPGFPAPPPVVASGTGTGASGFALEPEGYVHIHRNVIGDLDPAGGVSDINALVHRWLNPVASISITNLDSGDASTGVDIVSAVSELTSATYSSTAIEIFWQPGESADSFIADNEITRNGVVVGSTDGTSFFEEGLSAGTTFDYGVTAIDGEGNRSEETIISVTTNDQ